MELEIPVVIMLSKKEANILRFAVGQAEDSQSWIWRMWVHRDDVYLGARNALIAFKVSLHRSGIWRIAFVKELEREDDKSDRVMVKWHKPGEFAPGWTPSIAVLVSSIYAKRPFKKMVVEDHRIKWFSTPKQGNKLIFKVLFSKAGFSYDEFNRITVPGDQLVGKLLKSNGEIVWVVVREAHLTPLEIGKIEDVMKKTKIHLKPGSSEDSVIDSRALLVVSEDVPDISTQPTILDIPLGKENLEMSINDVPTETSREIQV